MANEAFATGLVESLLLLDPEDLRLDALNGLAHLRAQPELSDGKFPEGHEMLFHHAENRCQHPSLVFCVLTIQIAGLPFKWIHAPFRPHLLISTIVSHVDDDGVLVGAG